MKMPKKVGILFTAVGAVLILSALLLFLYNWYEDYTAGQDAENLLEDVLTAIEENRGTPTTAPVTEDPGEGEDTPTEPTPPPDMPVVTVNGNEYVGYLSIPALELELPVMSQWDYVRLKSAPCRQFGSTYTDDLVIAAHNFKSHFGRLSKLEIGSEVRFTDMDGIENRYVVELVSTVSPDDVNAVQSSGYDLVLYTCTPGGATRVVVFCNRESAVPVPVPSGSDS